MASTNKTTHYELSQYVSSDKPTYLVDYNGDMAKIDTGINTAKTTADTASTAATNAQTAAATAQSTANTAVTNAATAQSTADANAVSIGTLANLTTSAKTNLVSAINEVDGKEFVVNNMSGSETTKAPSVMAVKEAMAVGATYSTSEYDSGQKWINGKTIYKKVIQVSNLSGGTTHRVATGINFNTHTIIGMDGMYKQSGQYFSINFPNPVTNNAVVGTRFDPDGNIFIINGQDASITSGDIIIEYIEND